MLHKSFTVNSLGNINKEAFPGHDAIRRYIPLTVRDAMGIGPGQSEGTAHKVEVWFPGSSGEHLVAHTFSSGEQIMLKRGEGPWHDNYFLQKRAPHFVFSTDEDPFLPNILCMSLVCEFLALDPECAPEEIVLWVKITKV